MSSERIEVWIRRLRDTDINVRREAIQQLEALGDPAALGALAAVFALDTDLETRKMAQWAGKSI
ncbi:MAG TPA: HEAT repeat domain-containing protein, partial [Aggregatilineales bacterium]|nr:HEAT repeat domain-containing protein [Aggregatilineales bacterium]